MVLEREPDVFELRERIDRIKRKPIRMCVKFLQLIDGRISEAVSEAYPSDVGTTPRGPLGRSLDIQEHMAEEAALFSVNTAKRDGLKRICALPFNNEYEPWTKEVVDYFQTFDYNDPVFPFTRQTVWRHSKDCWKDLYYKIEPYNIIEVDQLGNVILDDDGKRIKRKIDVHFRTVNLHAGRHIRASDLVVYYGFIGADLSAFAGWTLSTAMGMSSSVNRYVTLDWRSYFPKLLRKRF